MNKKILIIKNITREGPGLLEEVLRERHIDYHVVDLSQNEALPSLDACRAVFVLGGPDSANDENEKIHQELSFIQSLLEARVPYLGICLGLQLLVKAAGGRVVRSPLKEIGFNDPMGDRFSVKLTPDGIQDPLFKGLGHEFSVFHLHGETVEPTDDMTLLGIGKFCQNQVLRVQEDAYGIQCHFELTPQMFKTWINEDPDLVQLDEETLSKEFESIQEDYTQVGRQLFNNFLKIAGF